jgi:hypothetical protein
MVYDTDFQVTTASKIIEGEKQTASYILDSIHNANVDQEYTPIYWKEFISKYQRYIIKY